MPSPMRVVLLRDGSWPRVPGVCCWRHGLRSAFAAAGADVAQYDCPADPPAVEAPGAGRRPSRQPRMMWLPPVLRQPLTWLYRSPRWTAVAVARARRAAAARAVRAEAGSRLRDAGLVVAESPAAAGFAVACGVPRHRLWVLALPVEHLMPGESIGPASAIAKVAPAVGGFLAGSETARSSVERACSPRRARVELFPPVAADRSCPGCAGSTGVPAELAGEVPDAVAELMRLRMRSMGGIAGRRTPVPAPRSSWDGSLVEDAVALDPDQPEQSSAAQDRTARWLLATVAPSQRPARTCRSVLLAGHDLKFALDLAEHLDRRADLAVNIDDWPDLLAPTAQTLKALRHADSIFAEWARTSAVWLSQRTRPDQFLVVRLHRFELDYRYPREIEMDNVGAVVYIAPLFGRRIRDELAWPVEKLVYIPNFLDVEWFDRPKLPGARFTIGFVGMEWSRKRFDLALDLLAALRREDHRFRLVVRSAMPWQNEFAWARPEERRFSSWCFSRIERDPLLRDAVSFDPPGGDMARWYRRVGHLASTSDEEGSHASVAEAMASGSVPVVRAWPGAVEVYDKEWVHDSTEQAAAAVLAGVAEPVWATRAARAKAEIRRTHDPAAVVESWADLLHGDVTGARRRFAAQQVARLPEREQPQRRRVRAREGT